ncbi:MAG: hypothetical protein ACNA8W_09220, partial [Bradymonadaceae bacterium]
AQGNTCYSYNDAALIGDSCQAPNECNDAQSCANNSCLEHCALEGEPCATADTTCVLLQTPEGVPLPYGVCAPD